MNSKLERFDALDKVIINLETEAEKLGSFSGLVARVDNVNKDLEALLDRQNSCHHDLQALIATSGEPVDKIQELTKQLDREIEQVSHKQSDFYDRQRAGQEEYFQAFLARQETASEKLQDGIRTITLEVKKIDPDLLEEMRVVYQESQSELTRIRNLLEQMMDAQHKQRNQLQDLQNQRTDHEKSINQRFTKLDLSAEKSRHLPDALEQLKNQLQEMAEENSQYRETKTEHQREITSTLNTLSKFSSFSRIAFLGLAALVIISFFVGA